MNAKTFVIEIKPLKESLNDFAHAFGQAKKGKRTTSQGVSFSDVATFRKFFSRKRMELLKTIRQETPKSVYQLAKCVDREYKNVHDDVNFFKELGLVTTKEDSINLIFDRLVIEVEV